MEKTKAHILELLTQHKRLTRGQLSSLAGVPDRKVRIAIAELRDEGHMIGITADAGYSIGNKTDFARAIAIYKARASKEFERVRNMERTLENENQIMMSL